MANTFELISAYTATGTVSSIAFTSIPSTYTDLVVLHSLRDDRPTVTTNGIRLSFNGSTTGFTGRDLTGSGSAASSGTGTNLAGVATSAGATANTFANTLMYIPNYAGSNNKSYSVDSTPENNATTSYMQLYAGLWSNSAAITSITLSFDSAFGGTGLLQYSTAYLYGVKSS
jgi:hypothetical protein